TDDQGFPRFDVQFTKTIDGNTGLNLQALGGALSLNGSVDVSVDVHVHLVFGLDGQGFYIDADAPQDALGNPAPARTPSNLQVSGARAGSLGFLPLTVSTPMLVVDPSVRLVVALHTPAGADALRLGDLFSFTPGIFQVSLQGTHTQDVVL